MPHFRNFRKVKESREVWKIWYILELKSFGTKQQQKWLTCSNHGALLETHQSPDDFLRIGQSHGLLNLQMGPTF